MDEGMILGNLDLKEGSTRGAIKRTFLRVNSLKLKIHHPIQALGRTLSIQELAPISMIPFLFFRVRFFPMVKSTLVSQSRDNQVISKGDFSVPLAIEQLRETPRPCPRRSPEQPCVAYQFLIWWILSVLSKVFLQTSEVNPSRSNNSYLQTIQSRLH